MYTNTAASVNVVNYTKYKCMCMSVCFLWNWGVGSLVIMWTLLVSREDNFKIVIMFFMMKSVIHYFVPENIDLSDEIRDVSIGEHLGICYLVPENIILLDEKELSVDTWVCITLSLRTSFSLTRSEM